MSYYNNKKESNFTVRSVPMLIDRKEKNKIYVGDYAHLGLSNNIMESGKILSITSKTITLLISDYEYTETGAEYTAKLILLRDIESIDKADIETKEIDWSKYSEGMLDSYE